jgi:hypothetical protein
MPSIAEVRSKFPQYSDMSDEQFADALHRKHYSDMPREDFNAKIGLAPAAPAAPAEVDQPWYVDAAQAADDIVRLGVSGITGGYADKFAGYMSGDGTDAERVKTEAARNRAGLAGTVAEIGGAVLPAAKLAQAGVTASRFIPQGLSGVKGLAARTAAMGVDNAALGAFAASGNDQDIATGAGIGLAAGAAGNVVGEALAKGVGKVAGMFNKKPAIPSVDDIRAAKTQAYAKADAEGVIVAPQAINRLKTDVQTALADIGYDPAIQPKIGALVNIIDRYAGDNATMKGLENVRKLAVQITKSTDPSERFIAGRVIEAFDNFQGGLGDTAGDVIGGNAKAASALTKEGRELAKRQAKTELLDAGEYRGDLNAASSGSGGNTDNAIRQRVKSILVNPKQARMFSEQERKLMEQIVRGGNVQNTLRLIGKLSPQGNGLMAALGIGGAMANPVIGLASLAGLAAKPMADNTTRAAVTKLNEAVRAGSLQAATPAPNAVQRLAQSQREALARALAAGGTAYGVAPR